MFGFLLVIAIAFIVYAVVTQYKNTDREKPVVHRVWAALVAAAGAIGALVQSWFTQ